MAGRNYHVQDTGEDLPPMVTNYNVPANPNRFGSDPLAEYRVRTNPGNWRHSTVDRDTPWIDDDSGTGSTCDKVLGTHAFRNFLLILSYSLVIAYVSSIRLIARDTKNWAESRMLGYSQSEICWSMNYDYTVMSNITVHAEDEKIDVGVNSIFMDFQGDRYICFKDVRILNSMLNDTLITSVNLDERYPNDEGRVYFPFDDWIITLSCIGIVICVLFDESRIRGNGRSRYHVLQDKLAIKRTNFIVALCVGIGLLFSVPGFRPMQREECFRVDGHGYDELNHHQYCDRLQLYGIEVRSIIYPPEFLARHYSAFIVVLSLLVLSFSAIRNVLPSDDSINANAVHDENTATMRIIRNRNRHNSTDVSHIEGLISMLYGNRQRQEESRGEEASASEPEIVLPSLEKWKFFKTSPDKDKQECPICLGNFAMPPTPRPSVKATTHAEVHDGDFENYIESNASHNNGLSGSDDLDGYLGEGGGVGGIIHIKPEATTLWDTGDNHGAEDSNNSMDIAQLPCGHLFHRICILNWSIETGTRANASHRGASCPVCRVDLMT